MVLLEVEEPISGSESAPRLHQGISRSVIAAAIEVHRALGPGLFESAYKSCLCRELALRELNFRTEVSLPIEYKAFTSIAAIEWTSWSKIRLQWS